MAGYRNLLRNHWCGNGCDREHEKRGWMHYAVQMRVGGNGAGRIFHPVLKRLPRSHDFKPLFSSPLWQTSTPKLFHWPARHYKQLHCIPRQVLCLLLITFVYNLHLGPQNLRHPLLRPPWNSLTLVLFHSCPSFNHKPHRLQPYLLFWLYFFICPV